MYNNPEQQPPRPEAQQLMAPPRMSFSSDFALEPPPPRMSFSSDFALEPQPRPPGRGDADFEFSLAGSRPMMDADQLFSKGRILPLREAAAGRPPTTTTLRDELRAPDADRGRRGPRWKELLGLKQRAAHNKKGAAAGAAAASAADAHHVDLGERGEAAE